MSTEVAVQNEAELALIQAQDDEFDSDLVSVPILKIGQPLTREVQNELAEPGEFINTLTSESLGDSIEFIIAYYNKGRFAADDDNNAYVAFGDTIPEQWEPLVGSDFVGSLFREYPDAEETFKARVNAKEIEWGKGPLVSTTHNFTGFVVPEVEDDGLVPVRLSLKRTDVPAARKIITLKRALLRSKPFWDLVFELGTEKKQHSKGNSYNVTVKTGRKTDANEKGLAQELAQAVVGQRVVANDSEVVDAPVEPANNGGLAVG